MAENKYLNYEGLKTYTDLLNNKIDTTNASSASKLENPHTLVTLLDSNSPASFDGTGDAEIGVSGILQTINGGTGNDTGTAPLVSTAEDTSSTVYLTGVTDNAPTALKRNSNITMASGNISATTFTGDLNGTASYATLAKNAESADTATIAVSAETATQLTNARTIQVNLESTSAASFNGTENITTGVAGTLPIGNGGTGNVEGRATLTNTTADTASTVYPVGVTSSATTTLRRDTGITMTGGVITASSFSGDLNGTASHATQADSADNATVAASADTATQLTNSRTIQTDLTSTSAASFNGTENITPGVSGILPVTNGGTGNTNGTAAYATTASDTSNSIYPLGVTSSATTTLKRDTSITMSGGNITATTFTGTLAGNATTATSLANGRTIQINLSSTSAVTFDGLSNVTPGVMGTLATDNGGTGNTTGTATYATTASDTSSSLYPIGVTSGSTTALKRDTSIVMSGGTVTATTFSGDLNGNAETATKLAGAEYDIYYAVSESTTYYPSFGDDGTTAVVGKAIVGMAIVGNSGKWTLEKPTVKEGEYLWWVIKLTYADGTVEWSTPHCEMDDGARQQLAALEESTNQRFDEEREYTDDQYLHIDGGTLTGQLTVNDPNTSNGRLIICQQDTDSLAAGVRVYKSNTGNMISLLIGSGGTNRGIYDDKNGSWILYADSSNRIHLGSDTVGGAAKPIYLSSGIPTACDSSLAVDITGNAATATTATSATSADSATTATKVGSATVGGTAKPIYLSSGTATACSGTVGGASTPVYMSAGTVTALTSTVGTVSKPVFMSAGAITALTSTVGGTATPVFMSSGAITACTGTVGDDSTPVYMSSGKISACTATVGAATQPVFMSSGKITVCDNMTGMVEDILDDLGLLTGITLNLSDTTIASSAYRSTTIQTVVASACTTINQYAFANCTVLTTVSFPVCTTIGSYAFYGCYNLKSAIFPSCTSLNQYAFSDCSKLSQASFSRLSVVGSWAFYNCGNLTTVSFPSCTTVSSNGFRNCGIKSATFPRCTYVSVNGFNGCTALSVLSFSSTVSFSDWALYGCTNLEALYLMGSSICTLVDSNVFEYTPMIDSTYLGFYGSIYVPASLLSSYQNNEYWHYYSSRFVGV